MYLEENKEINEIKEIMGDDAIVKKVLRMVDLNEFKRNQAAPALRVSSKAFGLFIAKSAKTLRFNSI